MAWCFPTSLFSLPRIDLIPATSSASHACAYAPALLKATLIGFLHAVPTLFLDTQLSPCAVVSRNKCSPVQSWPRRFQQLWMEREGSQWEQLSAKTLQPRRRGKPENRCSKTTDVWPSTKEKQISHLIPREVQPKTPTIRILIANKICKEKIFKKN